MPAYCTECGKKRKLNDNRVCKECSTKMGAAPAAGIGATASDVIPPPPPCDVDDEETLNNVKFGSLKSWLNATFAHHVSQLDERLTKEIGTIKEDLQNTKESLETTAADVTKLKQELSELKKSTNKDVTDLKNRTKVLEAESKNHKTVSDNNLKYLINLDRNVRRKNVIIFGVPEEDDLTIDGVSANTDQKKCELIMGYIGVPAVMDEMNELFRLGRAITPGKPRPIKFICSTSSAASSILGVSKKLKDLPDQTVYVKPDKTKSEIEEFKRLGEHKKKLEADYPTPENSRTKRVILEKGKLTVDGTEVDEYKSTQSLF